MSSYLMAPTSFGFRLGWIQDLGLSSLSPPLLLVFILEHSSPLTFHEESTSSSMNAALSSLLHTSHPGRNHKIARDFQISSQSVMAGQCPTADGKLPSFRQHPSLHPEARAVLTNHTSNFATRLLRVALKTKRNNTKQS